jgi:hypothetical protein
MNNEFDWVERGTAHFYFSKETGKVVGHVSKMIVNDIYIALVYTGQYTFTLQDERHLGQYINLSCAKDAVSHFWDIQNRTLLENHAS